MGMSEKAVVEAIRSVYPKISAVKLGELLDVLDEFIPGESEILEVAVNGTHQAIRSVEIYGLSIGVDANGRAATVAFPDGATWI